MLIRVYKYKFHFFFQTFCACIYIFSCKNKKKITSKYFEMFRKNKDRLHYDSWIKTNNTILIINLYLYYVYLKIFFKILFYCIGPI